MQKLLYSEENLDWLPAENFVETYWADVLPSVEDCPSAYAIVFKNGAILQTELREGERPTRRLDIPGGHVDEGETPEGAAVRETFEETGVHVKVIKLVGFKKVTVIGAKPENYKYPYPISYMAYYLCDLVEETPFTGNEDAHGRIWLSSSEFETSDWCKHNKVFINEILK